MTGGSSRNPQKLLQAIRCSDNRLYTRTTTQLATSESNWTAWQEGNGITIKTEPKVISFQTTGGSPMFIISAYGTDNGLYTRSLNETIWTDWVIGGSITIASRIEQLEFQDKVFQIARGTDIGLYS